MRQGCIRPLIAKAVRGRFLFPPLGHRSHALENPGVWGGAPAITLVFHPRILLTNHTSRGVWLCDKASDRKVKVEPPPEWGRHWAWNFAEDGSGIYFRHTAG